MVSTLSRGSITTWSQQQKYMINFIHDESMLKTGAIVFKTHITELIHMNYEEGMKFTFIFNALLQENELILCMILHLIMLLMIDQARVALGEVHEPMMINDCLRYYKGCVAYQKIGLNWTDSSSIIKGSKEIALKNMIHVENIIHIISISQTLTSDQGDFAKLYKIKFAKQKYFLAVTDKSTNRVYGRSRDLTYSPLFFIKLLRQSID
ncbi:hypothetical protein ACJX0J_023579 [Zea mays]